jgi:endonuclease YncB( thermonuclease family)
VRDAAVTCAITGVDDAGHAFAICQADHNELNLELIAAGWAHAGIPRHEMREAERIARLERRGVWGLQGGENW